MNRVTVPRGSFFGKDLLAADSSDIAMVDFRFLGVWLPIPARPYGGFGRVERFVSVPFENAVR